MGKFPDGSRNIDDYMSAIIEQRPKRCSDRNTFFVAQLSHYLFTTSFKKQLKWLISNYT